MKLAADGHLVGISARDWFHIRWLHLNRAQLIVYRQLQERDRLLREAIEQAEGIKRELQERIRELEREVAELRAIISRLI